MRTNLIWAVAVAVALVSAGAPAATVTDYSWLQLPPGDVTPIIGGGAGGGSGYGAPGDFRWGNFIWIPDGTLTGNGASSYFAGVQFDQARPVDTVRAQWWANEGTSITRFFVDGYSGGSWTQIGSHNYGSAQIGTYFFTDVTVTGGSYERIRIRMEPGDYTNGTLNNPGRGGPGLFLVEPFGDGTVADNQVNWANDPSFPSSVSNNGLDFNGTGYISGTLREDGSVSYRAGDENWPAGDYMQVNLGATRVIDRLVGVYEHLWDANAFDISYSTDGTNFFPVTGLSAPTNFNPSGGQIGATFYSFDPVSAVAFRVSNASGGDPYEIYNQVMLYGPLIPEPSAFCLSSAAIAGFLALRRRLKVAR